MAEGLIVNVADARYDRLENRNQAPCFYTSDGTPVFEVWFWHKALKRWFCMTNAPSEMLQAQSVVCFRPGDVPLRLREQLAGLERAATTTL